MDDAFYFFNNDPPVDYSKIHYDPIIVEQLPSDRYRSPGKWEIFVDDLSYRLKRVGYMLKYNLALTIGFLLIDNNSFIISII